VSAVLLLQDLAVVPITLLLPVLAGGSTSWSEAAKVLGITVGLLVALVVGAKFALPILVAVVAKAKSREVFTLATMLAVIATAFSILVFTSLSSVMQFPEKGYWNPPGSTIANLNNNGAHGFSEILYTYASATGNNGSAFAGITANTPWYDLTIGLAMLVGRFLFLIPLLAAAGSLAAKKKIPSTAGTLPTHGPLFVGLLVGTVLIVGALTFFPALSLGPIVEHYLMHGGQVF